MRIDGFKGALLFALVIILLVVSTRAATYGQENAIFSVSPGALTVVNAPPLGSPYRVPQNLVVWNRDNVARVAYVTSEIPPENAVTPGYVPIPNENWVIPLFENSSSPTENIPENSYALIQIYLNIPRWENLTGQKWEVWVLVEREPLPGEIGILRPIVRIDMETTTELPLISHDPIYINGNDNFIPANGVVGGSGTAGDSYIIENWDISAESVHGIEVSNTDAYFIIRNCYMHDGRENYDGVHLNDVKNGTIENVNFTNDFHGIYLGSSPNNLIQNCTASNNSFGIYSWVSENNTFRNNVLSNNWRNLGFHGTQPSHFYQDLDNSNTVEGRPVYYLVEKENLTIDGSVMDIGYLGLVSCKNILVKNLNIRNNINAVLLANTTYSTVMNCVLTNSSYGVHLNNSSNNIIENCVTLNNSHGIYLHFSSNNNIVRNCTVSGNTSYGIIFYLYSDNNRAYHNNILNNINQARDEGTNYWDDGYPSGGNYWSDFTVTDYRRGENQNLSGSDQIWDAPYNIPGGSNLDRYPLRAISLVAGWNLVCFAGAGASDTPNGLLAPLIYNTDYLMYYWNAPGGPYGLVDPTKVLQDNLAYWVYTNTSKTVITSGTRPTSENVRLKMGWNLVSFPIVDENTTPYNIFGPFPPTIYYWNAPGGPYSAPNPVLPLKDNMGYWIDILQDKTVTVP